MSSDPRIGRVLSDYRIESLLGRGGQGIVYLAEHVQLERKVAFKVMPPEMAADPEFRERFLREARLAASLDHPNILPVYDAGEIEGELFLAQRLVRGMDLGAYLERERHLSAGRALDLLEGIAGALDTAHRRGLVHRDVKPGNILIELPEDQHDRERVYLADFGLTKPMMSTQEVGGRGALTRAGFFVGTPYYSAPEQVQGKQVDGRADQYALACVLYQCLTGDVPFGGETETAVLVAHVTERAQPVSARRPDLPAAFDAVMARAMAKEPAGRFPTCAEFIRAGRDVLGGLGSAPAPMPAATPMTVTAPSPTPFPSPLPAPGRTPAPAPAPARPGRGRQFALIGGGLGALVAVIVILAVVLGGGGGDGDPTTAPPTTAPLTSAPPTTGGSTSPPPGAVTLGVNQFVYAANGAGGGTDIFRGNADGTGITALTNVAGLDTQPAMSPDRSKIAFVSDRDGNAEIYVMNADGTGQTRITNEPGEDGGPAWSPDGTRLAFHSDRAGTGFDLFVMNADGSNVTQITFDPVNSGDPTWDPEGRTIAYDTGSGQDFDIHIINADGTADFFFAGTLSNEEFPAWSPDGSTIVFHGNANGTFDIVFADVATGTLTPGPASFGEDKFASWSPDGSQIVFTITGDLGANLAVADRNGQNFTEVIQGLAGQEQIFAGDPSWSR